ncbi:CPCC family cysteine-rich protein [Plantactinospora solaniradicis]|uniref:CPCC family cysteine-rich protein n=1 Tax=Plantactinospora solaniradicis TaxID=1723736 RepID=A0ABW1KBL7_9ACTN
MTADQGIFYNVRRPPEEGPHPCPCCGYLTLDSRGEYEICPVCFWEDDGQDEHDAGQVRGGANRGLSLLDGRRNFAEFGASEARRLPLVRPPHPEEHPLKDHDGAP